MQKITVKPGYSLFKDLGENMKVRFQDTDREADAILIWPTVGEYTLTLEECIEFGRKLGFQSTPKKLTKAGLVWMWRTSGAKASRADVEFVIQRDVKAPAKRDPLLDAQSGFVTEPGEQF